MAFAEHVKSYVSRQMHGVVNVSTALHEQSPIVVRTIYGVIAPGSSGAIASPLDVAVFVLPGNMPRWPLEDDANCMHAWRELRSKSNVSLLLFRPALRLSRVSTLIQ